MTVAAKAATGRSVAAGREHASPEVGGIGRSSHHLSDITASSGAEVTQQRRRADQILRSVGLTLGRQDSTLGPQNIGRAPIAEPVFGAPHRLRTDQGCVQRRQNVDMEMPWPTRPPPARRWHRRPRRSGTRSDADADGFKKLNGDCRTPPERV